MCERIIEREHKILSRYFKMILFILSFVEAFDRSRPRFRAVSLLKFNEALLKVLRNITLMIIKKVYKVIRNH